MAKIEYIPYANQQAEIERQRKFAQLLQQQASEPLESQQVSGIVVPTSPWLGLAKALQMGLGSYMESKAAKRESELKKSGQEEAQKYFSNLADYAQGKEVSGQAPVTKEISGYGATGPLPVLNVKDGQFSQAMQDIYATPTKAGMLARMMQGMTSENPDIARYAGTIGSSLMPKETSLEMGTIDPSKFTPASIKLAMQSNDPSLLEPITETKAPSYQRTTKEWSDQSGNKWKQDYAFDPTTKRMEVIGDKYLAEVYHAPGTSKDDDTKAGANLRAEYNNNPVIKQHAIVSSAYNNILNNQETGAGDMALIFQYMKMLDPNSAVREGEYATAENSGSIPQSVRNYYNRAISGERLQPGQRQAFISQADDIYQTSAEQAKAIKQGIEQIGKETGVNPRLYSLPEPKRRKPSTSEPPAGFVPESVSSQSNFATPQNSLMFQFPSKP